MSSRLNYAKAKRRVAPGFPPWPSATRKWRTEWPEEFPVTVTQLAEVQAVLDHHGITLDAINAQIAAEDAAIESGTVVPIRRPA